MKAGRVAVLEGDPTWRRRLLDGLTKAGLKPSRAQTVDELGDEGWVVIGPKATAPRALAQKARGALPDALVLFAMQRGFKAAWADGVLPLPLSPLDLRVRLPELSRLRRARGAHDGGAGPSTLIDTRTQFYTYAHFKDLLFVEVKRARRHGLPLALALAGLDPLGRALDDELRSQVLAAVAMAVRRSMRDTDFPVQFSADRMLLLMPHTELSGARVVAQRLCERVAHATVSWQSELLKPTLSVGIAALEPKGEATFDQLAERALRGLERAMSEGGNRVETWKPSQEP